MDKTSKHINLRSEEIQDILGKTPTWLTRYGSLFILLALLSIIAVSAIVSYPDVVDAPITINSTHPPIPLYAKKSGNIESLLVADNESITKGQILGVLENGTNFAELQIVSSKLDSFIQYPQLAENIVFPEQVELGSMQASYADFLRSYGDYEFFEEQEVGESSIAYLEEQIQDLNNINAGLKKQNQNCTSELQVLNNNYLTDLDLAEKGVISQRDVDESMAAFMEKKAICENLNIQISNNQLRIKELKKAMFDYSSGDKEDAQIKSMLVKESAGKLKNEINLWEDDHLLIAPVDGYVSLNNIWSDKQYVEAQTEILAIVQGYKDLKVFAQVNSKDIAQVKVGQQTNIRLEAYYFMEYGLVQGEVSTISAVPRDNLYQVEIILPNGLNTTYGKQLEFTQGMRGTVEIISKKRTFLARILDRFHYLFSQH